jgi:putative ABC transport system ATP-binding protein
MNERLTAPGPLVSLDHVSHSFDDGRIVALKEVSLDIRERDSVAIVGASGSGKSTLILLLCGIRLPVSGRVLWRGEPVTEGRAWTDLRRTEIGIVFQEFNLFPTLTARENIEVAMFGTGLGALERRRRAEAALETVGLAARAAHLPHELSGGERQRVAIARSIINNPTLILADEPTGNLDSANAEAILDLLFQLKRDRGATLVIVTHEPSYAGRCARQISIKDGKVEERPAKRARKEVT